MTMINILPGLTRQVYPRFQNHAQCIFKMMTVMANCYGTECMQIELKMS